MYVVVDFYILKIVSLPAIEISDSISFHKDSRNNPPLIGFINDPILSSTFHAIDTYGSFCFQSWALEIRTVIIFKVIFISSSPLLGVRATRRFFLVPVLVSYYRFSIGMGGLARLFRR